MGTIIDNKCTECKEGFEVKNDFENDNNCYKICDFNYYYESNNEYKCTDDNNCPTYLNKLIKEKKRCVDNCIDFNLYEYKNECLSDCPNGTHIKNNICLEDLNCEQKGKYYNYDKTECIDNITSGYYCNDTDQMTIDKCHDNCKTCEQKGTNENNLCKSCNIENGYYPKKDDSINSFFNCFNEDTISDGYYLNTITEQYEPCEQNCKKCNINRCIECKSEYDFKNDFPNDNNCYKKCTYNYYFNNSVYYCTENNNCPEEYNLLIIDKKRCIDDCSKDNEYKYQYDNNCTKNCPQNTETNEFFCEPCEGGVCGNSAVVLNDVNNLMKEFPAKNISCENNKVEVEDKEDYIIYIYKNNNCSEVPDDLPLIDFPECYNTIKENNNIEDELIVTKIYIKENDTSVYSFYDPYTLDKLDSSPCNNQTIIVQEDVTKKISNKLEDSKGKLILDLINQGINVFNVSDEFYTDICYHYNSPNGKDVPIKARISAFFPNITLCEKGCDNVGVDIQTMKAKCECKFIDIVNMDIISDNVYGQAIQEIFELINELNIAVVKCVKDIFKKEYFAKNTGGFIIISLFVGQVICFIKFIIDGLYSIRKYIFDLTQSYFNFMGKNIINNNLNVPPKKRKKGKRSRSVIDINSSNNQSKNALIYSNINSKKKVVDSIEKKNPNGDNKNDLFKNNNYNHKKFNFPKSKKSVTIYKNEKLTTNNIKLKIANEKENKINIKEYLSVSFDENDFDDVLDKDKRTFCTYFCEKFQFNQIFINAFFIKEPLRPRTLKVLVLIMTIELYFVINAFFYNEDYLSDLFNSTEEEKFFSFIPRRFNHFIYTSTFIGIISYFVGYVFVEEDKIKKIFRRNKEGDLKMRYELSVIVKDIEKNCIILIFSSIFLTIICFIYISCFNVVYPYIKKEWIKSSLFILIFMQIINLAFTFIECILRYSAIKCNNEKLFRLSHLFAL